MKDLIALEDIETTNKNNTLTESEKETLKALNKKKNLTPLDKEIKKELDEKFNSEKILKIPRGQ